MPGLTSFTEHQVCCQFARENWIDVRGIGLPPVGYDLGGVSGGPMLHNRSSSMALGLGGSWGWYRKP
jgi:hypothetical protein